MKRKEKVLALFVIVILIIGAIVVAIKGFNYGIVYKEVTELKFMLGQVLDMNEVENIVKEAFNNKEMRIQKINTFNDSVNISVVEPTDEEIQALLDKFNERYEQNNEMSNITKVKTANTSIIEIIKPYILPVILVLVLVAVYMGIRYRNQGILKVTLLPVFISLVVGAVFFAVLGITRIPITIWTMPLALILIILTLVMYTAKFEKNMVNTIN